MALAHPGNVHDFEKFDQSFKTSEMTRLISSLNSQESSSNLRLIDFFDPDSEFYSNEIPYLPEIDLAHEKKEKARGIDLIPAKIESEFRSLKTFNLKKSIFTPKSKITSMINDLGSPQMKGFSTMVGLGSPSRIRKSIRKSDTMAKGNSSPVPVDFSPGKPVIRKESMRNSAKFVKRKEETKTSLVPLASNTHSISRKSSHMENMPSIASLPSNEPTHRVRLAPLHFTRNSIQIPKKLVLDPLPCNLYPFPRGLLPMNELEIARKGLEISVKEIKDSEAYAYSATEVIYQVVSSIIETELFSSLRIHYSMKSYDSLCFWQGYLLGYSTNHFEFLLKVYFGKLHFFGRGELPSTLNSCYQAGRTVNLILANIMVIPSLSKCRKDIYQLCLDQLPVLIKALRHSVMDRNPKTPVPESITKLNQSESLNPESAKRPIGAFRLELATTLLNIIKLDDETNELINFQELPETLIQIIMIWFFEDSQNQLIQSIFHKLVEKIMTKGKENSKMILCFRLGLVSMISSFTEQVFLNNSRITSFELDYDTMVYFVKKIVKLVKENANKHQIGVSLLVSPTWRKTLLSFGLMEQEPKKLIKRGSVANSGPKKDSGMSGMESPSSPSPFKILSESQAANGSSKTEFGGSFTTKASEKETGGVQVGTMKKGKTRSQSILRINTISIGSDKKKSAFVSFNSKMKNLEPTKTFVISS